jgi:signal peptidase I
MRKIPAPRKKLIGVSVFVLLVLFFTTAFRVAVVHGDSMLPTYSNGSVVLVSRVEALNGPLRRGDVVLARLGSEVLIKRVAYLAGEVLSGPEAAPFQGARERFDRPSPPADPMFDLKVPVGTVVVVGDNRRASEDSRRFGPVPIADILGKVLNAPSAP